MVGKSSQTTGKLGEAEADGGGRERGNSEGALDCAGGSGEGMKGGGAVELETVPNGRLSGGNGGDPETGLGVGKTNHTPGKLGEAEAGGGGDGRRGDSERELDCAGGSGRGLKRGGAVGLGAIAIGGLSGGNGRNPETELGVGKSSPTAGKVGAGAATAARGDSERELDCGLGSGSGLEGGAAAGLGAVATGGLSRGDGEDSEIGLGGALE